jgi:hypothetical protein
MTRVPTSARTSATPPADHHIVKADASEALLYLDWRALNGLRVGKTAADALANPVSVAAHRRR